MSGYGAFAKYYDVLTQNIDYAARAEFLNELIIRHKNSEGVLTLDLACGTGSLSYEFSRLGYEVIGVDASAEMLAVANQKYFGENILFLNQRMEALNLYGTVDVTVCALDSLNHIESGETLFNIFKKVSMFTNPGGLFIFDVNTEHKHRDILANNAFIYDLPEVFCCWQNTLDLESGHVDITLDFFNPEDGGLFSRETETFSEWLYSGAELRELLKKAGFNLLKTIDEYGLNERIIYVSEKQ